MKKAEQWFDENPSLAQPLIDDLQRAFDGRDARQFGRLIGKIFDQTLPSTPRWTDIIHPGTVNLIIGYKGNGKSALSYSITEEVRPFFSPALESVVVDFPNPDLLPKEYSVKPIDEALEINNAIIIMDEGTTKLPAGGALEEFIKECSSLSRQRNQIILIIFHTSRDIGSKVLRGIDVALTKEPSTRQIRYGSKDPWFKSFQEEALAAFKKIPAEDRCRFTFIDSEYPDFRGLMENTLPSFWSEEISVAWGQKKPEDESGGSSRKNKAMDTSYISMAKTYDVLNRPRKDIP